MINLGRERFYALHKKLIIKAIEELSFEELFDVELCDGRFNFICDKNISYTFLGRISVWGNLQIEVDSFRKYNNGQVVNHFTLADFFFETKELCQMSDATLAQFIEEGNQTIYADLIQSDNIDVLSLESIAKFNFKKIDQILAGHPKLIMNKGRIGWGVRELHDYAPESRKSFKLVWCAIKKDKLIIGHELDIFDIYTDSLSCDELHSIEEKLPGPLCDYFLVPVHPWQWERYIAIQFARLISEEFIVYLGEVGNSYTPQISIRTLSSTSVTSRFDIKLAISILNTSCVRGIPQKYIRNGYKLSNRISKIIVEDSFLSERIEILKEVAAASCPLPEFDRIEGGAYRFKELLGAVWREAVESKINETQIAIPTAALLLTKGKEALVGEYIKQSKLTTKQWLKDYFEVVILPLYHLQSQHGLGLVAHGQNTIVVLEKGQPKKLIIKDFHGDFRMSTNSIHITDDFGVELDQLPPEYLIHDLITGHFITVLRYFSRVVEEGIGFSESDFYLTLGEVISEYESNFTVCEKISLLRSDFEKVLVNSVRFKAGYSETGERLKPILGKNIKNPLLSK